MREPANGARLAGDVATDVIDAVERAGLIDDPRQAALALVAAGDAVVGIRHVLRRCRRVRLGQHPPGSESR